MNEATELSSDLQTRPVIGTETLADILFTLAYTSASGTHTERYYARGVNFWRDILPESIYFRLMGKRAGDSVTLPMPAGQLYPAHQPQQVLTIPMSRFRDRLPNGTRVSPRRGRYYPKGLLEGLTGVFPQNTEPFRCVDVEPSRLTADMNHPLAATATQLTADIQDVRIKAAERGGTSIDWFENLTSGPGMQVRNASENTDFFVQSPFERSDESPDERFYRMPRFVNHLDDQAIELIGALYGSQLKPNMRVLDLMSSWVSHLPPDLKPLELTGLGMNRAEMTANERLDRAVVHDLNRNPELPFDSGYFDAVICTVSVEYMTRPFDVFEEISRILKADGTFIVTFSNRWFPPKVVRIWQELHDFERMGLVLEYFMNAGKFTALETLSIRGYPRPIYDRYFPELQLADPVYAVWGRKA
jgi:SAM-dependent methyltransferase/FKBP-type peptidyl-prolyl cis-trans isomerase 2